MRFSFLLLHDCEHGVHCHPLFIAFATFRDAFGEPNHEAHKPLIRQEDCVRAMCIVETDETSSTRILSKHIESQNDLRLGASRAIDLDRSPAQADSGCSFLSFGLTRRKRDRAIGISVFAEHDTFLLSALPARQRPMRRRTVRFQSASRIPLTPLRTKESA